MRKTPVIGLFVFAALLGQIFSGEAQAAVNLNASDIAARAEIFFAPQTGTFIEGSTFEVPIFINTRGNTVNTIELHVRFDPTKLSIVKPSGGKSIIELWIEPPTFNNTNGTLKVTGVIPNGLVTNSGLIANISFQAKNTGQAIVSVRDTSRVLLNDGIGSPINYETNRGIYTIVPKPPEGVEVFSETHPFQDRWYNNPNPVLNWNKDAGVTGFSVAIDNKPNTIPGNQITTADTVQAYEDLKDGLWYFHIKAQKRGVWGGTTHRLIRIDTTPPAAFTPTVNYLSAVVINRSLISFFTTDSLSGMDHYEVGVIDKAAPTNESPAFFQVESPYQLPLDNIENATAIVRAFDRAGNVRDASVDIGPPFLPWKFLKDNAALLLFILLILILLLLIKHLLSEHRSRRKIQYQGPIIEQAPVIQRQTVRSAPLSTIPPNLPTEQPTYVPLTNEELLNPNTSVREQ